MATEARIHELLGERLGNLREWLVGALEIAELRQPKTISQAADELLRFTRHGWDGDIESALAWALVGYVECGPGWADNPETFHQELQLTGEPKWTLEETRLLMAFVLADQALAAFNKGTRKQIMLAAMLYADAVEAREAWDQIRGPAGARNPDTRHGEIQKLLRSLDGQIAVEAARPSIEREARSSTARRGAAVANASKKAAKQRVREFWDAVPERDRVRRGAVLSFAIATAAKVADTTVDGIRRWVADWRKESSNR